MLEQEQSVINVGAQSRVCWRVLVYHAGNNCGDDETISLHYLVDDDVETKSADRW